MLRTLQSKIGSFKSLGGGLLVNRRALPLSVATAESYRIQDVIPDDRKGLLQVQWEDGMVGKYPYVWLQDCAPSSEVYQTESQTGADYRRLPLLAELNLGMKPQHVEILPVGQGIMIEWPPYHQVNYKASWLRQHFDLEPKKRTEVVQIWGREDIRNIGGIPTFDALQGIHQLAPKISHSLETYGLVRLQHGGPYLDGILEELGINLAENPGIREKCFTRNVNDIHTGIPFYDPIPNLGIMEFINDANNGQVQFADGYKVAKTIQKTHPFTYRYLCTTPIKYGNLDRRCEEEFITVDRMENKTHLLPVFGLDEIGLVQQVTFSNAYRSSRQNIRPESMHTFYAALKLFSNFCYDITHEINLTPTKGDLVLMDNHRVLHGTTAFDGPTRSNYIQEAYLYWRK